MSDSISEKVFAAIIAQLRTITLENGYRTDAGANVLRARRSLQPDELPAIVIFDEGETPADGTADGRHYSMTIQQVIGVEVHTMADKDDTGQMIGLLKADVKQALLSWANAGGLVSCVGDKLGVLSYDGCTALSREDGGESESCALTFTATYKEGYGNPSRVL
jgi:hypothetical protein